MDTHWSLLDKPSYGSQGFEVESFLGDPELLFPNRHASWLDTSIVTLLQR
jgi:hypothetical protein